MSLYRISVERPVLAMVMSIIILIFGVVSYQQLGVREYPAVDPPIISVVTTYTGAPPEVIESQITELLEEQLNAVAGISTLTSVSREGRSIITIEFEIGEDLEIAANDVRDKVAGAQRRLPPDADPPTVTKADADRSPVAFVSVFSPKRDLLELTEIADRRFKPSLQTIPGVAEVSIWGEKRYAMRLWLDRDRMASQGVSPLDVREALDRENVELPSGRIEGSQVELTVRSLSRFETAEEFNRMVIREKDGQVLRLEDVGYAELGQENMRSLMKRNGVPSVGVVLRPQPGANQVSISEEMYRRLKIIQDDLPEDLEASVGFDVSLYVQASIHEVIETIGIAVLLVVFIMFVFLRTLRSTLIPTLVIPVSIIGGFFVMHLAGYSINILTLLAMVLAIGLVVDDAIIVLENIYTKFEKGLPAREAALEGTKEVFVAVIATTLALVMVFAPILFLGGLIGQLFKEFAVVLAGTVLISAFASLTLVPMLCSKFLEGYKPSRFYYWSEPIFERITQAFRSTLEAFLKVKWLVFPLFLAIGAGVYYLYPLLPSELAPLEDRSRIRIFATAPEGASYEYMAEYMDRLTELVADTVPEAESLIAQVGQGSSNTGNIRIGLVDRPYRERSQMEIAQALSDSTRKLSGARVSVIQDATISLGAGAGSRMPLQFVIQASDYQKLEGVLPEFLRRAEDSGLFSRVDVDLKFNKPEVTVSLDRERAHALGVSARSIGETLNLALADQRYGYFLRDGRQYYVMGALMREDRNAPNDLSGLTVPSKNSTPVRLDNLIQQELRATPPQIYRFNRYVSATVSASMVDGVSLGEGIQLMQSIASDVLDESFETDLAGEGRDLRDTSSRTLFAFVFALALLYFILAGQFECFRSPLVVLLTVPLALIGSFGALWILDQSLNIFSQIGIIMLIGLITKNGILIVEFANQQREKGLSMQAAIRDAASQRFRPILMTSLCTILGILPIALALGAGSESRRSMGIVVIGGMLMGTLLSLYVVPALYLFLAKRDSKV